MHIYNETIPVRDLYTGYKQQREHYTLSSPAVTKLGDDQRVSSSFFLSINQEGSE